MNKEELDEFYAKFVDYVKRKEGDHPDESGMEGSSSSSSSSFSSSTSSSSSSSSAAAAAAAPSGPSLQQEDGAEEGDELKSGRGSGKRKAQGHATAQNSTAQKKKSAARPSSSSTAKAAKGGSSSSDASSMNKLELSDFCAKFVDFVNSKEAARSNDTGVEASSSSSSSSSTSGAAQEEDEDVGADGGSSKKRKAQSARAKQTSAQKSKEKSTTPTSTQAKKKKVADPGPPQKKAPRSTSSNTVDSAAEPSSVGDNATLRARAESHAKGRAGLSQSINSCDCHARLKVLAETILQPAKRAPSEKGKGEWNLARLKVLLEAHAFDERGNYLFHNYCMCTYFTLHAATVTGYHHQRLKQLREPNEKVTKEVVAQDDLYSSVIVPEDSATMTQQEYVDQMAAGSEVEIVRRVAKHGLAGKISNRSKTKAREVVVEFANQHCIPNDSLLATQAAEGQPSCSAPFYFDKQFKVTCRSKVHPPTDVLALAALKYLKECGKLEAREIPGISAIESWLLEDFLRPSALVKHCVIFPHPRAARQKARPPLAATQPQPPQPPVAVTEL